MVGFATLSTRLDSTNSSTSRAIVRADITFPAEATRLPIQARPGPSFVRTSPSPPRPTPPPAQAHPRRHWYIVIVGFPRTVHQISTQMLASPSDLIHEHHPRNKGPTSNQRCDVEFLRCANGDCVRRERVRDKGVCGRRVVEETNHGKKRGS